MWPRRLLALGALLALLAAPHAGAHGGRAQPGDTLERATLVAAPARLFEEGVVLHYYRVELGAPTTLRVRLAAPPHAPPGEAPMLLVFGPGLPEEGVVPAGVQRPGEGGVVSFLAAGAEERVDARLGVRWLVLLERELPLEAGTHHVVVHAAQATPLALLLDAPAARWLEPVVVPLQRDEARAWAGAPWWTAPAAAVAALALVGASAWRRRAGPWTLVALGAHGAALVVLASAFALAFDGWRVGEPRVLALALASALAGAGALAAGARTWRGSVAPRALLAASAVAAFALGAGALWGPLAALVAALAPEPRRR